MDPVKAAEQRALLTKLAKQANQRLVRLERAKEAKNPVLLTAAMTYAHRALAQVGRKRFEEHNKGMTDKQVAAALRRVSRFLNMPESTIAGAKKQRAAYEARTSREAKGSSAGPGVLGVQKKTRLVESPMEKRAGKDNDAMNYERYKQLVYRAMQTKLSKTFTYQTISQSVNTAVQNGFDDDRINYQIWLMSETDNLTRDQLLDAFGDKARAEAEAEEMQGYYSPEEITRWKRRKKSAEARKKRKSAPPRKR